MIQTFVGLPPGFLRSLVLLLGLAIGLFSLSAKPRSGTKSQSLRIDFQDDALPQGQLNNVVPTNDGLTQFRRNLEGVYTSPDNSVPLQNASPFFTFALVAEVANYNPSQVHFRVRFSNDGVLWTAWDDLDLFHEIDPDEDRFISELVFVPKETQYYSYSIVFDRAMAGASQIWVENVRLDFFNPGQTSGTANPDVFKTSDIDEQCACPLPDFTNRTGWDCPDGQNPSCSDFAIIPTSHIIVHHSAGLNN
ncbi:MAG: hypothetical protein AAFO91_18940, partial [Bacteroidota bacterium]